MFIFKGLYIYIVYLSIYSNVIIILNARFMHLRRPITWHGP